MSGTTILSLEEDLLHNSTAITAELLSDIIFEIENFEVLKEDSFLSRNKLVTKISEDITKFIELTTLSSKLLCRRYAIDFEEARASHIQLLFVLKGINSSYKKQDIIALDDLIMHELKDILTQWKIDIIPKIKRILNS